MRVSLLAAALASLCAVTPAQSTVSPARFATSRGTSANTFPLGFRPSWVYQQIHTDVPVRAITAIAFRQGGNSQTYTARNLTAAITVGNGSYANRSTIFAQNFVGATTVAMAQRQVSLPDWRQPPAGGYPAPFTAVFPFDRPWLFTKQPDLCWQLVISASDAGNANYGTDAASYPTTNSSSGSSVGTGCLATGQGKPMTLASRFATQYSPPQHTLSWSGAGSVANQPGAALLGLADPNQPIPGLCANVRVNGVFLTLSYTATATGSFQIPTVTLPYNPTQVGFPLYGQAACADTGQSGLPIAVSNGNSNSLPMQPPKPDDICRIYAYGNPNAVSGSLTSNYGLITELR